MDFHGIILNNPIFQACGRYSGGEGSFGTVPGILKVPIQHISLSISFN